MEKDIITHLKIIEAQNNAIIVRQGYLGAIMMIIGAERGKKVRELCEKYYDGLNEAFNKNYVEPLKELVKE